MKFICLWPICSIEIEQCEGRGSTNIAIHVLSSITAILLKAVAALRLTIRIKPVPEPCLHYEQKLIPKT